jgi:hypothetical protein
MASPVLRDKASTSLTGAAAAKKITLPSTVQPGDLLILHWAAGGAPDSAPLGWGAIPVGTDVGVSSRVFFKFAVTGDASSQVTVPSTDVAKVSLTAQVWANADSVTPLAGIGGASETVSSLTHVSAATASSATGPVIQMLALKDTSTASTSRTITPGYQIQVDQSSGGGSALVGMVAVSAADVAAGTVPAATWFIDQASPNAHMITLALAPRSANRAIRTIQDITTIPGTVFVGAATASEARADEDENTYALIPVSSTAGVQEQKLEPTQTPIKSLMGGGILDGSSTVTIIPELVQGTTVLATFPAQVMTGIGELTYTVNLSAGQQASQTILNDLRLRETITGTL